MITIAFLLGFSDNYITIRHKIHSLLVNVLNFSVKYVFGCILQIYRH